MEEPTIVNHEQKEDPQPQEPPEVPQPDSADLSPNQIKISESAIYRKYFKMLKFGIPPAAVKQKMSSEGLDADFLDNQDLMIEKTPEDDEEQ